MVVPELILHISRRPEALCFMGRTGGLIHHRRSIGREPSFY